MTQIKSNIPKIRFKEFSGEWEEKKLGKVSDVRDGTHDSPKYQENGYPLITSKNLLKNGKIDYGNINNISDYDYFNINKRSKVNIGDILFGMIGTIGNPVIVDRDDFAIKNVALIKEKNDLINIFLINYLKTSKIEKQFYELNAGGTQKFIALGVIRNLLINLPQLPEQQKIASFLSSVDEKIENIKEKKKSLEEYKKGVMQKIFSREIRFKDESGGDFGEWEEKKIGEVFNMKAGNSKSKYINKDGNNIIIDMGAIGSNYKLIGNKKTNYSDDYLTKNDLVMAKDDIGGGNIIGKVVLIEENNKYILGDHVYKLTLTDGIIKYLYYAINSYKINKFFRQKANGTAQIGITNGTVLNQLVPFPSLPEQQKIADFLSGIDDKIESVGSELERVEEFKKGLLQGVFV